MTRDEAKQLLPIIQAYSEGKEVEWLDERGRWMPVTAPMFTFGCNNYRIKPEPVIQRVCWVVGDHLFNCRDIAENFAAQSWLGRVIRMREVHE